MDKTLKIMKIKEEIAKYNDFRRWAYKQSTLCGGKMRLRLNYQGNSKSYVADLQLQLILLGCPPEEIPQRWDPPIQQ